MEERRPYFKVTANNSFRITRMATDERMAVVAFLHNMNSLCSFGFEGADTLNITAHEGVDMYGSLIASCMAILYTYVHLPEVVGSMVDCRLPDEVEAEIRRYFGWTSQFAHRDVQTATEALLLAQKSFAKSRGIPEAALAAIESRTLNILSNEIRQLTAKAEKRHKLGQLAGKTSRELDALEDEGKAALRLMEIMHSQCPNPVIARYPVVEMKPAPGSQDILDLIKRVEFQVDILCVSVHEGKEQALEASVKYRQIMMAQSGNPAVTITSRVRLRDEILALEQESASAWERMEQNREHAEQTLQAILTLKERAREIHDLIARSGNSD